MLLEDLDGELYKGPDRPAITTFHSLSLTNIPLASHFQSLFSLSLFVLHGSTFFFTFFALLLVPSLIEASSLSWESIVLV